MARANDKKSGIQRKRTKGEQKQQAKIRKQSEKIAHIRRNTSHHISKDIADSAPLVVVFEALKLNNMVLRPKAKPCPKTGHWLRNGAKAKSGLNKSLLNVNLGQIRSFTEYKLKLKGKLFLKVKPHYSSQECANCGHTEKKNRLSQSKFKCLSCGHTDNADYNASKVIKKRGIMLIRSGKFSKEKTVRKASVRRKKVVELPSLGCGGFVSLSTQKATTVDALNRQSSCVNSSFRSSLL
jgi:putative transposase